MCRVRELGELLVPSTEAEKSENGGKRKGWARRDTIGVAQELPGSRWRQDLYELSGVRRGGRIVSFCVGNLCFTCIALANSSAGMKRAFQLLENAGSYAGASKRGCHAEASMHYPALGAIVPVSSACMEENCDDSHFSEHYHAHKEWYLMQCGAMALE